MKKTAMPFQIARRALVFALLASAGLVSTGRSFADAEPDEADLLRDVEWRVTEIDGAPVAEGSRVTMSFDADGAYFGKACNNFRGSYTASGNTLSLGRTASTMMACPEPMMAQERALFDVLAQVAAFSVTRDGALWLSDEAGNRLIEAWR